jgi:hypothetical protein
MNSYELSRAWFDWCFENPEKITPNHTALYFFCVEHCNRLGWKERFGLPTTMAKEAIGIRSYNTYIKTLNDLVEFGFIKMVEKSKNQYSSNIIALSKFNKALDKALDKAFIKHMIKQDESTSESIDSIDKQITINKEPINNKPSLIEIWFKDLENSSDLEIICIRNKFDINQIRNVKLPEFRKIAELDYPNYNKFVSHFKNWVIKNPPKDLNAPLKMVY